MTTDRTNDGFESDGLSLSRLLLLIVPVLMLGIAGLWYASSLIQPPPQKIIGISTGGEMGAYHAFSKQYQSHLAKKGIKAELKTSAGSIQNLERLRDPRSGVSVALLQGGIAEKSETAGLVSIGRMFYEPLWIFYRNAEIFDRIGQLKGLRLAVGSEGSGTRKLTMTLLSSANINAQNSQLLPITGPAAVDALKSGGADAVMLTFAPEAPLIQSLLRDTSVKLMSLSQADALSRIYPYLAHVTLPQGVIDLEKNIPSREIDLIAPVAALVAREDLHPALVAQLAEAAAAVHSGPNLLTRTGEFPRNVDPEFEMSADAVRFYKTGPSLLQRYLPFWFANFLERMLVLVVPLATVLIPLMRGVPAFVKWRVQRKLTYWYGRLDRLESGIAASGTRNALTASQASELEAIHTAVSGINVPRAYSEQYYNLRGHIDMVRARLTNRPALA